MIENLTRTSVLLVFVLTKEGLGGKVKLKGSLGCSDHESVEFEIFKGERAALRKVITLGFVTADLASSGTCSIEYHWIKSWR